MKATYTMIAANIRAPGEVELEEVPVPVPGPGMVRVRVLGCGICGSNVPPWRGLPWLAYPRGPGVGGHEGWGVVDAVGPGVTAWRGGERVAFLSGRAWATYDLAQAHQILALSNAALDRPFPGEAFACAFNVVRRSGIRPGDTVAIVGIGFLGAIAVRQASLAGAQVIAVSRRTSSRALATTLGAHHVIDATQDRRAVVEEVRERLDGRLCDRVIEAVGAQGPLDLAAELTRERGTLVIAGYHQDGPRQVDMQLWNWRGIDVVNAHERDPAEYLRGMADALGALDAGTIDPTALVTHVYPLSELGAALEAASAPPEGFVKAVVLP